MGRPVAHEAQQWISHRLFPQSIGVFVALTLSACGGSSGDTADTPPDNDAGIPIVDVSDPTQCNAATQKQWAYNSMRDFYLYYDQVPVVDPQLFDDANDLVRSVRFEERDGFSHVSDTEESSLQFDEGREFGLGYGWRFDDEDNARITRVARDSPFGRAGIERGDIIVSVDGLAWKDEALSINFGDRAFGTPDNPATAAWRFEKRDTGQIVTANMTATEYDINTVLFTATYDGESFNGKTGYLAFSRFLNTSEAELNTAFDFFQSQNITELVLDLRYNRGGRVSIARQLTSLVGGSSKAGKTIYEYRFNNKYPDRNYILDFQSNVGDLGLSRVIVLTSGNTASASEIVIAGLQPHMDVVTIGGRTTGKPYVQYAYDRCGERLALIEAEGFNDAGVSVFGGIPAMCYGEDDPTVDFGLSSIERRFEGLLNAGIQYITTGACATAPVAALASRTSSNQGLADNDPDYRQGMSTEGGALAE